MNDAADSAFPQTRWSLVLSAQEADRATAEKALSELCEAYWYPLYVYVRRDGKGPQDAEDLTQGFFESLIRRGSLEEVQAERGKLRSYLLGCLKHYLADMRGRANALKRGGHTPIVSYDALNAEQRFLAEPRDEVSPEVAYDRRWASTLLASVRARLEEEYEGSGKGKAFRTLQSFLSWGSETGTQARAAKSLGISENAVRLTVLRMRRRYATLIREVIADTVSQPEEVDEEIAYLFGKLPEF